VSAKDPAQKDAILCCHQNDELASIDAVDNCSRWLCNGCRMKMGITTDSTWYCSDHARMHIGVGDYIEEDEEDEDEED
jgi:hypothetical protein